MRRFSAHAANVAFTAPMLKGSYAVTGARIVTAAVTGIATAKPQPHP
jgi:hypothetical protein